MYDKRYSNQAIQRIRNRAAFGMFVCMAFLVFAVGKVAYQSGYVNGYNARMNDDVVNPVTSFVPAPPKTIAARIDIQPIPEPGEVPEWKQMLNLLLKYWLLGCIVVAFLCFMAATTPKKKDDDSDRGDNNSAYVA